MVESEQGVSECMNMRNKSEGKGRKRERGERGRDEKE